jgi:hypothetical protein
MRDLRALEPYRDRVAEKKCYGCEGDYGGGMFRVPSPIDKAEMAVIASDGEGWDHVSVSRANRCPNWIEMDYVKRAFFKNDEVAMQLHVPAKDHINKHPHCLHLWRPQHVEIPRPPGWMVA